MAISSDELVAELEQRIVALEVGQTFDVTKEEVRKVEYEFLIKFRDIRAALQSESGKGASVNSSELEALKLENEQLRKRNDKLEYRVQHVVANMEQMYSYREA